MIHCIPRVIKELHFLQTNTASKFSSALSIFLSCVIKIDRRKVSGLASLSRARTTALVSRVLLLDSAPWCDPGIRGFTFWFQLCQYFLCVLEQSSLLSIFPAHFPLLPRCSVNHKNEVSYPLIMFHVFPLPFPAHVGPHICRRLPRFLSSTYRDPDQTPSSLNKTLNFPCFPYGPSSLLPLYSDSQPWLPIRITCCCCLVTKLSCPTLCNSMDCSTSSCSPLSPRVCSNSCSLSQWCYLTISYSAVLFFCLQSFPSSESFPVSWLFTSSDQKNHMRRLKKHQCPDLTPDQLKLHFWWWNKYSTTAS